MVFQDPLSSLNPRQSVECLLVEPLNVHGLSAQDAEEYGRDSAKAHLAKAAAMLEVVGLPRSALSPLPARVLRRSAAADRHRPSPWSSTPTW